MLLLLLLLSTTLCHANTTAATSRGNYISHWRRRQVLQLQIRGGSSDSLKKASRRERIFTFFSPKQSTKKFDSCSRDSTSASTTESSTQKVSDYNPLLFYRRCMVVVLVWIGSGTLFYSYCNQWPLPQSFFYAVDAGMSIGFCTEVHETKLVSKAFTIIFILLGASAIGGALALFIQDMVEGVVDAPSARHEYHVMLERQVFDRADVDRTGVLSFEEFERLIQESSSSDRSISSEDVQQLWTKFDRLKDGVIHFEEEFAGTFRGIDRLVQSLQQQQDMMHRPLRRIGWQMRRNFERAMQLEHRIYFVFGLWIALGVSWGMVDQHWDIITATHFAVSALATGGLTGPDVNADGILPPGPSIFCGVYCLLGIPLFALTLGHFARVLVSGHIAALERSAWASRPMTKQEYDLASHLVTPQDDLVHPSDFIVLQLLRRGKLTAEAVQLMKENFDRLDSDGSGTLSLAQAMSNQTSL